MNVQFDGMTFSPTLDGPRLTSQLEAVKALMLDGRWRSLPYIAGYARGSEAGISARLRDLRKAKFGGYQVERRRVAGGLYEYRVLPPVSKDRLF